MGPHSNSAQQRSGSLHFGAAPLAALALSFPALKSQEPAPAREPAAPPPVSQPAHGQVPPDLAGLSFHFQESPKATNPAQPTPASAPAQTTGEKRKADPAPQSQPTSRPAAEEKSQSNSPFDSKTSSIILAITLTAAAFTIGKRIFVEIKNVVNDFRNWLLGRSTLTGSIDVLDFTRSADRTFMEISAFGQINIKTLLEHAQAAKHFQRAAALCTPEQPFVSLNYADAAKGFIWSMLRLSEGVRLTNDQIRKRFDRELREVYSARFAQEIKRRLAGYSDKREAHVLIPMVDRWQEPVMGRFGKQTKLERAELCFLVLRQRDFDNFFSSDESADKLAGNNERYRRRIQVLRQAWILDQEHRSEHTRSGTIDIQLPDDHPDYPFRLAAAIGLWPVIKVLEKAPKSGNGGS